MGRDYSGLGRGATLARVKTLVLVNPRSGRRNDIDATVSAIRSALPGDDVTIELCPPKDELDRYFQAGETSLERVIAVGGDGTVSEIAKRLIGTDIALGVIPAGSGNGFARHLHLPSAFASALDALSRWTSVRIDTATVNGLPFIATASAGFDAIVAHRFAEAGTRGLQTYVRESLTAWWNYSCDVVEFSVDGGESRSEEAFLTVVANANQYGNEARIAPLASVRDGLLELTLIRRSWVTRAPMLLQQLFTGQLRASAAVVMTRGRSITLTRQCDGPVQIDGEPAHMESELQFEVVPRSLSVLVPEEYAEGI